MFNNASLKNRSNTLFRWKAAAQCLFYFGILALIYFRDPRLLIQPRFWAEEGMGYFKSAYMLPAWQALIAPHQGYYSFWANIAVELATLPPLRYAPLVTTLMSLVVVLWIFLAIHINDAPMVAEGSNKMTATLAALMVGATGEIWLNSINAQHYFVLLVFLILIDSKTNGWKRKLWYSTAFVAGLSSIVANLLTPLFFLRWWQTRARADLVLFGILACTALLQATALLYSHFILGMAAYYVPAEQHRLTVGLPTVALLHKTLIYALDYPISMPYKMYWPGMAAMLYLVYSTRQSWNRYWPFLAAVPLIILPSLLASLNEVGGPRYVYASSVIVFLFILGVATDSAIRKPARLLAGLLLLASLAGWGLRYRNDMHYYDQPSWPSWASQVQAWAHNPQAKLQAWPVLYPPQAMQVWAFTLPRK